jgi:hypothetical protein
MVRRNLPMLIPVVVIASSIGCGVADEPGELDRQVANAFIQDLEGALKTDPNRPPFAHRARAGRSLLLQIDRTAIGSRETFIIKVKELKAKHGLNRVRLEIGTLKYTPLNGGPTAVLGKTESQGAVRTDFKVEEAQDL